MGDPSRFLSRFFNVLAKTTGISKSKTSPEVNKREARIRNPAAALPTEIVRQFSLAEIKSATNNFHQDLYIAQGGFGSVYKGFFCDGNMVVAVKRFCRESTQGFSEFQNEVKLLCQLHHQNLVSLIGFCNDKDEMILVYEYLGNRTLRDHLFGSGYDPLPWKQRLEICIGAARGLHYLHSGAKQAIIHRDIKSVNILLDDNKVCKLSDFGLSKLRSRSKSKSLEKINSVLKGTIGYIDPEYMVESLLSEKSDVYSFGIVLFEVLCGRKAVDCTVINQDEFILVDWVRRCIGEGTIYNIIDPNLKGRIAPECFKIFMDIAHSCNQTGNTRPEMGEVEVMLQRALELQESADLDMIHLPLPPNADQPMYEEVFFRAFVPEFSHSADNFGTEDFPEFSSDSE